MTHYASPKPDRGGCLSWWLGVSLVVTVITMLLMLGLGSELTRRGFGSLLVLVVIVIALAHLACLYGIYNWKRWGVYGFVAISIVSLVLSILGGIATLRDFVAPIIQNGILWYLVNDKWEYFE